MNETNFIKLDNRDKNSSVKKGFFLKEEIIRVGNEGIKHYGFIILKRGEKERKIPVVIKEVRSIAEARRQVAVIRELESVGIPVPRTRRYFKDDDRHYIAFTDLSNGGNNLVWSINNNPDEILKFNLSASDIRNIKAQIRNIHQIAKGRFYIRSDAYFLVKEKDSLFVTIILGDFGKVFSISYKDHESYVNFEDWAQNGLDYAEIFLEPISDSVKI